MAATITHRVATPDTGNTPNASGAFSFASGDLLVVFVTKEASVPSTYASGDLTVASVTGVSSFTLITAVGIDGSNIDGLGVWVANQKATGAGAAGVVTIGSGSDAGAGSNIAVFTVAGLHASALGAAAVKQSGSLANQSTGVIPSIDFGTGVADTNNCVVGGIGVVDGTPALTQPTNFTEGADTGYTTGKAQGIETVFRNSGHTSQTVAWVTATTGGAWGGIILELNTVLSRTEKPSGIITPSGTRTESKSHTSKPTGTITLTGTRSESHTVSGPSNTDRCSGTIDLSGGVKVRRNLIINPRAAGGSTADWTHGLATFEGVNLGSGGAPAPTAEMTQLGLTTAFHGVGFGGGWDINATGVLGSAGVPYALATYFYIVTLGGATEIIHRLGDFTNEVADTSITTVGSWIRVESDKTFTALEDNGLLHPQFSQGTAGVSEFYFTGVLLEQAVLAGTYFDSTLRDESLTHTSKPTGTIVLTGTRVESHSTTDLRSGTVTLIGTRRESKSETFKTTGTVSLQGSVSESHAISFTDRRSGTVSLAGTRQESFTHVSKPTGTIQLSGTVSERNLGPTIDRPTGTIALTGTRRESFSRTEKQTGTVSLSGQIDETFAGSITDSVSGTIFLLGTRQESNSRTVEVSGQISITGTVSESYQVSGGTETHSVSGTITLSGTRRESRTYTDKTTGTVLVSGTLSETSSTSFTDTPSGVIVLSGTRQESNERTVLCDGIIVLSGQVYEVYLPAGLTIDRRSGTIRLTGRVRELHSRWDNLGGERWPADTDSRWPGDNGERWNHDSDSRWGQDAPERWETDLVP